MMRRFRCAVCVMLALLLCVSMLPAPVQAAAAKTLTVSFQATTYQNRARQLLKQINDFRKANGAEPLVMLADLEKASVQRAAELFVFFDHVRPDLTDYDTAAGGYASLKACEAVGECVAAGYSKAEDVFADWKKNAKATLLDADFTHVGIACVYMKGSANEYYWEMLLQAQPEGVTARKAETTAKAGAVKNVSVEIAKGMYERADNSHRRFELRVSDMNLKTRTSAQPEVYLYDRKGVKIGKCALEDLTYKSSDTSVFTVDASGTVKRKKAGTATLTVKCAGLDDATCQVTFGSGSSGSSSGSASSGSAGTSLSGVKPELTAKAASKHVTLSVYVKGASGYVLYRSATKTGAYTKVTEAATSQRWSVKLEGDDLSRTYYYKVRAYKNSNGRRVYSEYSEPVKVSK